MTQEEQRIAIAEACGWKCNGHLDQLAATVGWEFAYQFVLTPEGKLVTHNSIPDYLNDLNAMHDAVMCLDKTIHEKDVCLCDVFSSELAKSRTEPQIWSMFDLLTTTAAQQAEAFLCTIGKWKECK